MKERLGLVLLAAISVSACNEQNDANKTDMTSYEGRSYSVMGQLRPKADPNMIRQIHEEEEAAQRARIAEAERQQREEQMRRQQEQQQQQLPSVNTSPIAGDIQPVNGGSNNFFQAQNNTAGSWAAPVSAPPPPPQAASYGINYSTPSPGFVPPPPAVSLSTSAMPMGYGGPPPDYNPYANPYFMQQQAPAAPAGRAPGGLFGSSSSPVRQNSSDDDEDAPRKKKEKNFQIITPTGMEARSPYKQRDELRILWKGALASTLSGINSDPKFAAGLAKIDVGLPSEASKGSLSVAQRQVDNIFKNTAGVDKKIVGSVRKVQTELVQAYYRYLYAYNKFYLTQQQVQARKQELDCAESQAEKQRATVDLAQSQQEADASKDDMRSAQSDLASIVGAQSARTVIKTVSGVSPSLESIASAPAQAGEDGAAGGFGGILNVFGIGKSKPKEENNAEPEVQVASEDNGKEKKKKEKEKKKDKGDKGGDSKQVAARPDPAPVSRAEAPEPSVAAAPSGPLGPVSFELKDVKTTPRKSVLRVIVKNTGGDNFSFDADSISVAEGNTRLAEAAYRAEFDSTVVQPSQEVTGTITIFGRPWNDKLQVSLSDGGKPILLHR